MDCVLQLATIRIFVLSVECSTRRKGAAGGTPAKQWGPGVEPLAVAAGAANK